MIGKNISLRALEPADADLLYRWENDQSVWHISNTIAPYSRFDIDQYILNSGDIFTSKQLRLMIIMNEDPEETVGAIDLFDFHPLHKRAEVGILVYESYRGKGYAAEAIELLKDYAFNTLNLHQLYCHVPTDKEININLFTKVGFTISGTRKQWRWRKDHWADEYLMQLIP
jgi:diamine N-acetyltransferase